MNLTRSERMDTFAQHEAQSETLALALDQHRTSLMHFMLKRLRNRTDAEDAVQETSLRAFNYHQRLHSIESPTALLYRIAQRVAVDFQRRARSHRMDASCSLDDVQLLSDAPSPEQLAVAAQELSRLVDALERLPSKCQDVFILSRMEGLSYPEIGARCGISVKMVEKYISRALAELRLLGGQGLPPRLG